MWRTDVTSLAMLIVGILVFSQGGDVAAEILDAPTSVTASSEYAAEYAVSNLFDAAVTDADVGSTFFGNPDGQWAGVGIGPFNVFMEFATPLSGVDGFAYSQRLGANPILDKVGQIDFWFSDTSFGGVLPATPADASVTLTNTTNSTFTQYNFGGKSFSGQFVAAQFFSVPGATGGNIGGSEFRLTKNTSTADPNPVLTIDRNTGNITLSNNTADTINFVAYELHSPAVGALDASQWTSIAQNYDAGSPGPNQVDSTDNWIELTPAPSVGTLAEAELPGGNGVTLAIGRSIDLGNVWLRNPTEDITVRLLQADGGLLTTTLNYVGDEIVLGDFSGNGAVGPEDWPLFRTGLGNSGSDQSIAQAFALGDLDSDGDTDISDFRIFEAIYDGNNGAGALANLISSVPEPATVGLLACGGLLMVLARSKGYRVVGLGKARLGLLILAMTGSLGGFSEYAPAQTFTLTSPAVPATSTASSEFPGFGVANLFEDAAVVPADIGTLVYAGADPQYAGEGVGPMELFLDYGSSVSANYLVFAQRVGADLFADKIGQIEFWFSGSPFGGAIPATSADAVVDVTELSGRFTPYSLGNQFSGQYVAARLTISDASTGQPVNNIGGNELRLATGPSDVVLEVNRDTGSLTIRNQGALAQNLSINGYQITSPEGSLLATWNGFEGGSVTGFNPGNGTGNGWERGDASDEFLLSEAYLLGSSSLSTGAQLSLGTGYNTAIDVQDLSFSFSVTNGNGLLMPGIVTYVGGSASLPGDFNADGKVDAADYLVFRNNLGQSSTVLNGNGSGAATVVIDDYTLWRDHYGQSTGGTLLATQQVPEPTTVTLCLALAGISVVAARRHSRGTRMIATALALVIPSIGGLQAATPDAVYLFGDNSALGVENGAANIEVGSGPGAEVPGFTVDHMGDPTFAVLTTYRDLAPEPAGGQGPFYVNTAALGFPGTALGGTSTGVGIRFDGVNDRLVGPGLGNPSDGDDNFTGNYAATYQGLFTRMIDGWVRPTALNGSRQDIVNDTSQFGIHITANNTWGIVYGGIALDSGVDVANSLDASGWAHVHHSTNGSRVAFYVNGELELLAAGNYAGTPGQEIVFGSNLAGDANFFAGDLDNFRLLIAGDNRGFTPNGKNFGIINLSTDNDFIAATVVPGDANGDGIVNGDGTGDPMTDDIAFFVDNFFEQQVVGGQVIGDLTSITTIADFDGSGRTDILDWHILRANHSNPAALANVNLEALLAGRSTVPEPATLATLLISLGGLALRKRYG